MTRRCLDSRVTLSRLQILYMTNLSQGQAYAKSSQARLDRAVVRVGRGSQDCGD